MKTKKNNDSRAYEARQQKAAALLRGLYQKPSHQSAFRRLVAAGRFDSGLKPQS